MKSALSFAPGKSMAGRQKNSQSISIPLSPEAMALLQGRKENTTGPWVFPGRFEGHAVSVGSAWKRIHHRAQLPDLRIHDLRRTLGSHMAIQGVSPIVIGKALGHKSLKSTAVYTRLNDAPVREAIAKAIQGYRLGPASRRADDQGSERVLPTTGGEGVNLPGPGYIGRREERGCDLEQAAAQAQTRQAETVAAAPREGAEANAAAKASALDSQVSELRQNSAQWQSTLESGDKGDTQKLDQLGFPQPQVGTDATYIKIAGVKEEANVGEFIKRDVSPGVYKTTAEQSILKIAANHLGAGASAEQIKKHASEIYHLNFNSLEKADTVETATTKPGESIRMPGHTTGGAILLTDSAKNQYAITEDGNVKVTRADGTGFERSFTGKDDNYREVHFGPKETDKFTVVKSIDGRLLSSDRPETLAPKSVAEEKGQLERLIKEKVVLQPENEKFRRNIKEFEERASRDGLSTVEIARVYRDLSKILELKGNAPLTQRERVRMAGGAIAAAADPTSNDQGKYNTCQIATIENRLYAKQPSVVTDVLAQIATDGKFITKDGTVAPMERTNMRAHGDAALNSGSGSWTRSYASQIFQTASVTAFYTQENLRKMPPGDVHYYQNARISDYDSGETLVDYSNGKAQEIDKGPGAAGEMNNMIKINEQLTGKWQPELFMANKQLIDRSPEHNKATAFGSVDEFAARLEQLRAGEKGPLYATLFVRVNSDPLVGMRKNNPLTGPVVIEKIFDDGHVMNIVDYDAKTRTVKLDGQWGNSRDFINKPLSIEQAYAATLPPTGAQWMERASILSKTMPAKEFNAQLANLTNALSLSFTSDMQLDIKVDKEDVRKTISAYERLRAGRSSSAFTESDENVRILRHELQIQK